MKAFLLVSVANCISINKVIELENRSEVIPDFYDEHSVHNGPKGPEIPGRFKDTTYHGDQFPAGSDVADRTMHHLIRYYGTPELVKCNKDHHEEVEGESSTDWKKPVDFQGEWADCGQPTGKVLTKDNATKAAHEAVQSYFGFEGKKLEDYCKENVPKVWEHFDVNKEGKIEIERGPPFLRMIIGDPVFSFGIQ